MRHCDWFSDYCDDHRWFRILPVIWRCWLAFHPASHQWCGCKSVLGSMQIWDLYRFLGRYRFYFRYHGWQQRSKGQYDFLLESAYTPYGFVWPASTLLMWPFSTATPCWYEVCSVVRSLTVITWQRSAVTGWLDWKWRLGSALRLPDECQLIHPKSFWIFRSTFTLVRLVRCFHLIEISTPLSSSSNWSVLVR